jgi:hypothetical protein
MRPSPHSIDPDSTGPIVSVCTLVPLRQNDTTANGIADSIDRQTDGALKFASLGDDYPALEVPV